MIGFLNRSYTIYILHHSSLDREPLNMQIQFSFQFRELFYNLINYCFPPYIFCCCSFLHHDSLTNSSIKSSTSNSWPSTVDSYFSRHGEYFNEQIPLFHKLHKVLLSVRGQGKWISGCYFSKVCQGHLHRQISIS